MYIFLKCEADFPAYNKKHPNNDALALSKPKFVNLSLETCKTSASKMSKHGPEKCFENMQKFCALQD